LAHLEKFIIFPFYSKPQKRSNFVPGGVRDFKVVFLEFLFLRFWLLFRVEKRRFFFPRGQEKSIKEDGSGEDALDTGGGGATYII
jgi:hypothetical protein